MPWDDTSAIRSVRGHRQGHKTGTFQKRGFSMVWANCVIRCQDLSFRCGWQSFVSKWYWIDVRPCVTVPLSSSPADETGPQPQQFADQWPSFKLPPPMWLWFFLPSHSGIIENGRHLSATIIVMPLKERNVALDEMQLLQRTSQSATARRQFATKKCNLKTSRCINKQPIHIQGRL